MLLERGESPPEDNRETLRTTFLNILTLDEEDEADDDEPVLISDIRVPFSSVLQPGVAVCFFTTGVLVIVLDCVRTSDLVGTGIPGVLFADVGVALFTPDAILCCFLADACMFNTFFADVGISSFLLANKLTSILTVC